MSMLEIKDQVQRYLVDMGVKGIELLPDGGWTFRVGSARLFLRVAEFGEGDRKITAILMHAPAVLDLSPSPELFEYVARHADDKLFGHLGLVDEDDGTLTLTFNHTLLADYLDPEELSVAVGAVAGTADYVDNDLAVRFHGRVFHED